MQIYLEISPTEYCETYFWVNMQIFIYQGNFLNPIYVYLKTAPYSKTKCRIKWAVFFNDVQCTIKSRNKWKQRKHPNEAI